jgi:hypothetical protein
MHWFSRLSCGLVVVARIYPRKRAPYSLAQRVLQWVEIRLSARQGESMRLGGVFVSAHQKFY